MLTGWPVVGVTDADGRLVGLLTVENLGELMMVHSALPRPSSVQAASVWRRPLISSTTAGSISGWERIADVAGPDVCLTDFQAVEY